jgi:lipid-A-disaccharide synthase
LLKCPHVIAYKMAPSSWWLMKRMKYQPYVGLPNILAGRFVVPEFLQGDATPEALAATLGELLNDKARREDILQTFDAIHAELRQNTGERAAAAVLQVLGQGSARHGAALA